jgi:hypothetical protein
MLDTVAGAVADTRDLDRLEALHRRVTPIIGFFRNYLVAGTLGSIGAVVVAVISMLASGTRGEGVHQLVMFHIAGIGLLLVATALMQRMSRVVGALLLIVAALCLIVSAVLALLTPLMSPRPSSPGSLGGPFLSMFFLVTLSLMPILFFFDMARAGWLVLKTSATSRAICAEQWGDIILGRSAVLHGFGIPASILNAGQRRAGVVLLFWLAAATFGLGLIMTILLALVLTGVAAMILPDTGRWSGVGWFATGFYLPFLVVGMLLLWVSGRLRRRGRNRLRMTILEVQEHDPRPNILFLRAFTDDQVALAPSRVTWLGRLVELGQRGGSSLDTVLLEEGTEFGPVVALGNPNDPVPPYGSARGYFQHADWQAGMARLAESAQAIVICLEDSAGVWWEAEHLLAGGHASKTLFVLHPRFAAPEKNREYIEQALARFPGLATHRTALLASDRSGSKGAPRATLLGFFFDAFDGTLRVGISSTWSCSAYLLMLRWFLRERSGLLKTHCRV